MKQLMGPVSLTFLGGGSEISQMGQQHVFCNAVQTEFQVGKAEK